MKRTHTEDIPEVLDYNDGDAMVWGGLCGRCGGHIDAGDNGFLSADGVQTLCYSCANKDEFERMQEEDRRTFIAYLERLSNWQFMERNGLLDREMLKPTPPAFAPEF